MVKSPREESIESIKHSIEAYFGGLHKNVTVVVGPSEVSGNIHVMAISDAFKGKEQVERDTPIYEYIKKDLRPGVVAKISLLLTFTSDEYHDHSNDIPEISETFAPWCYPQGCSAPPGERWGVRVLST